VMSCANEARLAIQIDVVAAANIQILRQRRRQD
jgi:hypothetical protein